MNSYCDPVIPVLPQALRLARYQASPTFPQNVNDLTSENDIVIGAPSHEEELLLTSNANVVTALEDLFSQRQKDRTSRTSKLSRAESFRFQRAVYRIWLLSVLFGPRRGTAPVILTKTKMTTNQIRVSARAGRIRKRSSSHILRLNFSRLEQQLDFSFLLPNGAEGKGLNGIRELYDWNGMYPFAGPDVILRCYRDATTAHLPMAYLHSDDGPHTNFLTRALADIFRERHDPERFGDVGYILDGVHGARDQCHQCGSGPGSLISLIRLPQLYNNTNWDDLKGHLDREYLVPGRLSHNLVEKPLTQALSGDWTRLVHDMFACRPEAYSGWSKDDWTCTRCWSRFFLDTLWRWRLAQKRGVGERIEKDCSYGYACEDQCGEEGLAHAERFNVRGLRRR